MSEKESIATSFWRDLQAGIVPEGLVWGCLRLPMALLMVCFLGGAGWLLSGYAQGGSSTEKEYLSAPLVESADARRPNSRVRYQGEFLRQKYGERRVKSKYGGEVTVVAKYLAYCKDNRGQEHFGSFTQDQCSRIAPGDPVQFEVFNGVMTELDWKGEHFLAQDHPLQMRRETKFKSLLFAFLGVCAGLVATKLLLYRS